MRTEIVMPRPKIICQMHTFLNGKVEGLSTPTDIGMYSQMQYFDLMLGTDRYCSQHRGWRSGIGISRAFLGGISDTKLSKPTDLVPPGDFIADPDANLHYFAADRNGSLKRIRSSFDYFDVDTHIAELFSNSAIDIFKAHLRSVGVSYITAGEDELDMNEAARKIGEIFHTEEIILGGGGTLN